MRLLNLGLVVGVAALASLTAPAFADLTYNGWDESGSFDIAYTLSLPSPFVVKAISLTLNNALDTSGYGFTATTTGTFNGTTGLNQFDVDPSTSTIDAGGWTQTAGNSTTFVAASSATSTALLQFNVHGETNGTDGIRFTFLAYSDTNATNAIASGFGYFKVTSTGNAEHFEVLSILPLPAAFWSGLLMMGALGGVAVLKRRQRVLA